MSGYANYADFQGRYYAIIKSVDGVYWLVNPLFPTKITYTYTIDSQSSRTDFSIGTVSNHPILKVNDFNGVARPYDCSYKRCIIKDLKLNERDYSRYANGIVHYTNDGFKDIEYLKNSASFQEAFDGTNITHTLNFNINFDDYKSSWHYNLLEFIKNRYSAIISTTCGNYIMAGFNFGMHPSFTVNGSDNSLDNISMSLVDGYNSGESIWYEDNITITESSGTTFEFTPYKYECVGENTARYLLKQELDNFGNATGDYLALEGYEDEFPYLHIVGTFAETENFYNPNCYNMFCKTQTSFPQTFVFNTVGCRTYSFIAESDWTISSSSNDITVFPTSGEANTPYEIQICNRHTPTDVEFTATITLTSCETTKTYGVSVIETDDCFTAGAIFDISANGQYVTIPVQCCVDNVVNEAGVITNIQITDNFIRVYVPQNDTQANRQFILAVTFCDGTRKPVIINQGSGFERWVFEYFTCAGGMKCEVERKYTGVTAQDINTWTTITRTANCVQSDECSGIFTRWIDTTETYCNGGKKYVIMEEQRSTDEVNWTPTGNKKLGAETSDSPAECEGVENEEEWRVVENDYFCDGTTKYTKERLYTRVVGTVDWYPTDVYRKGDTVIEENSADCGNITGSSEWSCEKWEQSSGYMCEEDTKYALEERFVRDCNDCNDCDAEWIATGIYRRSTTILETGSTDCGAITGTDEWNCSKWEVVQGEYICDDTTKYTKERLFHSNCQDCNDCSAWVGTDVYRQGSTVIETNSTDCGYIKGSDEWTCEKWEIDDNYWICEETTKYKAEQRYVRDCEDCNNCANQWIGTGVYRRTNIVIETDSTDCGYYIPTTAWTCEDWRVMTGISDYICEEDAKYAKEQRYVRNCNDCDNCDAEWVATGVFRRSSIILEYNSEDCGYNPEIDGNCVKWQWDDETICDGVDKYQYLHKYVRNCDDCDACSNQWIPTEIYKRGELIRENDLECGYLPGDDYVRWEIEDQQCDGYDLYELWRKYVSEDNIQWYATDIYKQGDLIEENSFDCGYIPTEWTACTQWRPAGVICDGLDKYERLRKFITEDCLTYYATAIFKKGNLIEANSIDCGYIPTATYVKWDADGTLCNGYDLYERLVKSISEDNVHWYLTEIHKQGNLIEANAIECGYIPTENCYRWELDGTICDGFNLHYREKKLISDDCDNRWYATEIRRIGELIEENSEECGYEPSIQYEYRWVQSTATTCYRYDLVLQYKKQRRRLFYLSAQWEDVIPTVLSVDGDGDLPIIFVAKDTADCGYAPTDEPIYKWVEEGYICDECPSLKLFASYDGGDTYSLECNDSSTLTSGETRPSGYEYTAMTSAVIGDCVTSIGFYAFANCSGFTSVTIPNSVTSIGVYAFGYPNGLTSVTIPNSVTSIGERAFFDCRSLTSAIINGGSIGDKAFELCRSLTSVTIGNSVTSIGEEAFYECSSLTSVTIPDSVTSIGGSAFGYCSSLTSVTIPNSVTSIGYAVFANCSGFTSVTIPNNVTSIGNYAFSSCRSLTSITIPNNVTSIGNWVFGYCRSLTSVTVNAITPPTLGNNAFYDTNNCDIIVPASSVSAYKSASGWSEYADRIKS